MSVLQLAAPITPPVPDWWPPAPGWWLLAALLLGLLSMLWRARYWILDYWIRLELPGPAVLQPELDPIRQAALDELASLQRPLADQPAGPWLQQLNAILKRLCRSSYPDGSSHRLSGRAWLAFLDTRCPAAGLTRWMVLVEGTYRADCRLSVTASRDLQQAVETWIRKHA